MNQVSRAEGEDGVKTLCVGRFLVEAPQSVVLRASKGASGTATVTADAPVELEDFRRRVQNRWDVVRQRLLDDTGKPRVKPPESFDVGENGVVFSFDHAVTRGPDVTGKVGDWSLHTTEGHLWRDRVAYLLEESDEEQTRRAMLELRPMAPDQVPVGPGFCGPRMFVPGSARGEFVTLHAEWAASVPMALRITTSTYADRMGLNSLRPSKPTLPKQGDLRGHLLHEGDAAAGGLDGREWIVGFTEHKPGDAFVTSVTATWFAPGQLSSSDKPAVQIKLSAKYRSAVPPEPWGAFPVGESGAAAQQSRDEFMRAWRATLASFRLRPGAL